MFSRFVCRHLRVYTLYYIIIVTTRVTCLAVTSKYASEILCNLYSRKRYGYKVPRMKLSRSLFSDLR